MTNTTESAVDKAIRLAKEKAEAAASQAPIETQQVAVTQQGNTSVASYAPLNAQPATLDTLTNSGMNVDDWLKVNGTSILIGSKTNIVESFKARMRLQDITVFYGVRFGDPATYFKSFDRVTCVQGGSWPEALQKAQRADPKCKGEYIGGDFTVVTAEDVKDVKGVVVIEAGKRLGHSTSPTGGKPLAGLIRELRDVHKAAMDDWVLVNIKHVQRTKPGVAPWGVFEFEILEVLGSDDAE